MIEKMGWKKLKKVEDWNMIGILIITLLLLGIVQAVKEQVLLEQKRKELFSECFSLLNSSTDYPLCQVYADYMLSYGSDHFVCYYGKDSQCGKTKFCPNHVTKQRCEELGGVWFRENAYMDMLQRFEEISK